MAEYNKFSSDDELLKAIRQGEEEEIAKQLLYERYNHLPHRHVEKILWQEKCRAPKQHYEGVISAIWLRFYKNLAKLRDADCLPSWLVKIAKNEARRHTKKCRREQRLIVSLDTCDTLTNEGINSIRRVVESGLMAAEYVERAGHISPKFKQILLLRYVDRLSFEKISECMGETLSDVRKIFAQGMRKLRK